MEARPSLAAHSLMEMVNRHETCRKEHGHQDHFSMCAMSDHSHLQVFGVIALVVQATALVHLVHYACPLEVEYALHESLS